MTCLGDMERIPVNSASICSIGFDIESAILEIEFHSGAVYQYTEVPVEEFDSLMSAESHGHYFNVNIRNAYPFVRLEDR